MFELIFLGTSASSPSIHRGLSAHMLLYRQHRFLIDCGEGTQRQILRSGLGFKRLDKILLTHGHLDHILGLGGLISTLTRWETLGQIEIYGGRTTLQRVRDLLFRVVLRGHRPSVDLRLIPVRDGDVLLKEDNFTLSAFEVDHRGPDCFGYVFEEKARRPFLADRAAELGVPFGPERGRLVNGETLTLANGQMVTPEMVLGEQVAGVKYVHIGDVGTVDTLIPLCYNANALTIEATYTDADGEMAQQFGHMTASRAARLAEQANVDALLLTHISRRYFERDIRNEARAVFSNSYVARDFDHFEITRQGVTQRNLLDELKESNPAPS